jgi:retinol dehydrogenase-12
MGATVSYLRGTPGPSGFGSTSTAEDVTAGLDLHNYTAIVTGISFISSRLPPLHFILAHRNNMLGNRALRGIN